MSIICYILIKNIDWNKTNETVHKLYPAYDVHRHANFSTNTHTLYIYIGT